MKEKGFIEKKICETQGARMSVDKKKKILLQI